MHVPINSLPNLPYGLSALGRDSAGIINDYLYEANPKTILEFGSGTSTFIFAAYATEAGAKVISLEHIEKYYNQTLSLLDWYSQFIDLRLCKIDNQNYISDKDLPLGIDFVLIDGPPAYGGPDHVGREKTFPQIYNYLSPHWNVFLDDAKRSHEKNCLDLWKEKYHFNYKYIDTEKGLLHLYK